MIGKQLRHYRVDSKIGEGGMGVVYKGWDTHLDRPVAIKVLAADAVADPDRRRRFVLEAKSASALNHPNIVTVYDVDNVDGVDFIAMEYVDGQTLDHRIGTHGMRLNLVLKYAVQTADALVRAHAAGIIHRDLKPANVMVDRHDQIKILDFGLAKLTEAPAGEFAATVTEGRTERGTVLGTAAYMSPEQAEAKPLDARSDIFSFGTMLYEMVTGTRPFQGQTNMATIAAILTTEPKPAGTKAPGLPQEMERIISRCLRKDPNRRFQQMAEVKLALEDLKEGTQSGSASTQSVQTRDRRGIPMWMAALAALLTIVIGGWIWWRSRHPPTGMVSEMTRLTYDSGLTTDPALSSDGKLVAYASDRATGENLDIWLQHLGGGNPVRLTDWDTDEMQPDFSPDGSRIVFSSSRNGGGIYVVPVLGGDPAQVAPKGFNPRFSPDGSSIAYWVGSEGGSLGVSLRKVFVVPSTGGQPRQIASNLKDAAFPVWSPEGGRILLSGSLTAESQATDWWMAPADGGAATSTGAAAVMQRRKLLARYVTPAAWTSENWILFSVGSVESANLQRMRIGGHGKFSDDPERITFGAGVETKPAASAAGQLVLAGESISSHIWALPMDTNQGKPSGEMVQLTREATMDITPRVSEDGKKLVYFSLVANQSRLFARDVAGGNPRQLAPNYAFGSWTSLIHGSIVLFSGRTANDESVYSVDVNGGIPVLLAPKRTLWCASADGRYLITFGRDLLSYAAFDTESGTAHTLASHPTRQLLSPAFSPDGKWVAMHVRITELARQIFVLPFHPGRETPQSEWIPITDGKRLDRDPKWSPDGKLLYFLADRDGVRGFHAQRLDAATKHPVGAEFEVKMFRSARRSMMYFPNSGFAGAAVASDKIVFALGEMTGNIWLTKAPN